MSTTLLSSPLQGFTDFRFRNALNQYFGGIDTYFAPYIRLNGKLDIKPGYQRDLIPQNNTVNTLHPQIMTNDADEFLFVIKYVQDLGYKELNWNLGCPYPMVTKRGMGSGLICQPERIKEILTRVYNESDITISMKMRMGYDNAEEILDTFPILDKFPLKNIAIHARIGAQLYKGGVDLDAFDTCLKHSKHKIYYNGDITSVASYRALKNRFPTIDHWMIGRGLISDPFLAQMIKEDTEVYPENRKALFTQFHDTLFEGYASALSGKSHVLTKMTSFWEYWATTFDNPHKTYKKIKKSKSIPAYEAAVGEIFRTL
ncbi:tRNA-dihydrouridine synthase family protein [Putridiphycobacter roseus]|uniref:tRNA-dihydrouridine synthase n=1 Tax=Putridiphycobacter roseus TaxID=2219161 RepID=A0A2W1NAA3_9FLAO|nr:tRNA-dihydrouridine synthase family protein [Putridiphycobacter roseus]PZE15963.1 tRNA-dihydrouridine synthase family protein [Putridiphycobacter roseus]